MVGMHATSPWVAWEVVVRLACAPIPLERGEWGVWGHTMAYHGGIAGISGGGLCPILVWGRFGRSGKKCATFGGLKIWDFSDISV